MGKVAGERGARQPDLPEHRLLLVGESRVERDARQRPDERAHDTLDRQPGGRQVGDHRRAVVVDVAEPDDHVGAHVDHRVASPRVAVGAASDRAGRHEVRRPDHAVERLVGVPEAEDVVALVGRDAGEGARRPVGPQVLAEANGRAVEEEGRAVLDADAHRHRQGAEPGAVLVVDRLPRPAQRQLAAGLGLRAGPQRAGRDAVHVGLRGLLRRVRGQTPDHRPLVPRSVRREQAVPLIDLYSKSYDAVQAMGATGSATIVQGGGLGNLEPETSTAKAVSCSPSPPSTSSSAA